MLLAAGSALLALSMALGSAPLPFTPWVWTAMVGSVACGALTLGATFAWQSVTHPARWSNVWLAGLMAAGVIWRLCAIPAEHMLSDDAPRYVWDGKVVAHGINPYVYPPAAPEVAHLQTDAVDLKINHPSVRTCYPPVAQLLFAAAWWLTPGSLLGFQLLSLWAEIVTWLLLASALARWDKPRANLLLAIASPLLIIEGYLPGHKDLLGLPFLMMFVVAILRQWPRRAGIAFALACMIKPLPLVLLPAAVRALTERSGLRAGVWFGLAGLVTAAVFYAPFASAGEHLFGSMLLMAHKWSFNGTVAALLEAVLSPVWARGICGGLLLGGAVASAFWRRDVVSRWLLALTVMVAVSPVLFPWYLVWMVPLLVLRPDPALLALVVLAPLSEIVVVDWVIGGVWSPSPWATLIIFAPFYGLLALGAARRWGMFSVGERAFE